MSPINARPEIRTVKLSDLKPAPYNPRKIDPAAMAGLEKSLERFGVVEPIIWNERTGFVVGGHQRLKVLRSRKVKDADVVVVSLDAADEKALNVALNSPHITGEFSDRLGALLDEIETDRADLFHELRLGELRAGIEPGDGHASSDDLDEAPPIPATPLTKPGDVWVLDRHRLICGDATDPAIVARLMQDRRAALTFTSPPYNAGKSEALSGNSHMTDNKYGDGYRDDKVHAEYLDLLRSFTATALAVSDCVCVNLQQLAGNKVAFVDYLSHVRDHVVDIAVWDKGHAAPQMAAGVMANRFEYLVFLSPKRMPTRAIPGATFKGTVENVYAGPPQRNREFAAIHAATFPVHLPEWAIETFTPDGATILDPFAGTGTTLIACEASHRKARLVELDPGYCDVICARWAALTGGKPVLEANRAA